MRQQEFDVQHNISLADYVSWKTGGHAKIFFQPSSVENLQAFLRMLPLDENVLWLGLGSNLLVRDGGFDGTVIFTQKYLRQLQFLNSVENDGKGKEYQLIYAECGVACPTLARFLTKNNLTKGEWFAGVPGTLGGALAMNAGAFSGETWQHIVNVKCIDRTGELHTRLPSEFEVAYRQVRSASLIPLSEWFISATLHFQLGDKHVSSEKIKQLLQKRAATQPTGAPTCGSVFRNPPNDYAARLIETCELKAYRIGDAIVSEKHANFIINMGKASAHDLEALINHVAAKVLEKHGVALTREVKIVGDP